MPLVKLPPLRRRRTAVPGDEDIFFLMALGCPHERYPLSCVNP